MKFFKARNKGDYVINFVKEAAITLIAVIITYKYTNVIYIF